MLTLEDESARALSNAFSNSSSTLLLAIALHRKTAPASCNGNRGGSFTLWVLFQTLNAYQLAFSFLKF